MTIIIWDGTTLAADKRSVVGGTPITITKIFRLKDGRLFGGAGIAAAANAMHNWIEQGADPDKFPELQKDKDDWSRVIVIDLDKKVYEYERTPYPSLIESLPYAIGSGKDAALTTLWLGHTISEAINMAARVDIDCGNGTDFLTLE